MSASVSIFPSERASDRAIEQLAELIIEAEEVAYRRALADAVVDPLLASRLILAHSQSASVRARLIVARYRAQKREASVNQS